MTGHVSSTPRWQPSPPTHGTVVLLCLGGTALAAGMILAQPSAPRPLTALAGAALAFGLPGLSLVRALFPGTGLGRAERLALVLGLQLSAVALCGFLLHLLPRGLSAAPWGSVLADVTLLACGIAWIRSRHAVSQDRVVGHGWVAALATAPTQQIVLSLGAVILVAIALLVARLGVAAQPRTPWTALSVGSAQGGRAISVGVTNAEGHPQTYRLVVSVDGEVLGTIEELPLGDGEATSRSVTLPAAGAFLRRIDVFLWRAGDDGDGDPYRSVNLSLRGVPGP